MTDTTPSDRDAQIITEATHEIAELRERLAYMTAARDAESERADRVGKLDLIFRMDAVQACQAGPSDEWSKATKDGYNQAATDCARNMLRVPAYGQKVTT